MSYSRLHSLLIERRFDQAYCELVSARNENRIDILEQVWSTKFSDCLLHKAIRLKAPEKLVLLIVRIHPEAVNIESRVDGLTALDISNTTGFYSKKLKTILRPSTTEEEEDDEDEIVTTANNNNESLHRSSLTSIIGLSSSRRPSLTKTFAQKLKWRLSKKGDSNGRDKSRKQQRWSLCSEPSEYPTVLDDESSNVEDDYKYFSKETLEKKFEKLQLSQQARRTIN